MARKFRFPDDATSMAQAVARVAEAEGASERWKAVIRLVGRMLGDRDRALEDFVNTGGAGGGSGSGGGAVVFSYPGPLAAGVESPPFYPPVDVYYSQIRVSTLANVTVNTTVDFKINGTVITTVTLLSGTKTVTVAITSLVLRTDYVTMVLTAAADANLSVELS